MYEGAEWKYAQELKKNIVLLLSLKGSFVSVRPNVVIFMCVQHLMLQNWIFVSYFSLGFLEEDEVGEKGLKTRQLFTAQNSCRAVMGKHSYFMILFAIFCTRDCLVCRPAGRKWWELNYLMTEEIFMWHWRVTKMWQIRGIFSLRNRSGRYFSVIMKFHGSSFPRYPTFYWIIYGCTEMGFFLASSTTNLRLKVNTALGAGKNSQT